jgi:hypothetical protein
VFAPCVVAAQSGRIEGVLRDSLLTRVEGAAQAMVYRPLVNATVTLDGGARRATTDSLGRFVFDGVAAGKHRIAYYERWLEQTGLGPLGGEVQVDPDSTTRLVIATPSLLTLHRMHCQSDLGEGYGVLLGEVRDAAGMPVIGVQVRGRWREVAPEDARSTEMREISVIRRGLTTSSGSYVLCAVPLDAEFDLDVVAGGMSDSGTAGGAGSARAAESAPLTQLVAHLRDPVSRRDLVVGDSSREVRVSGVLRDSLGSPVSGATVLVLGDSSRRVRTDADGRYQLSLRGWRSQQLATRAIGFTPAVIDVNPVAEELEVAAVQLEPFVFTLDTARVVGRRDPLDWRPDFEWRRTLGAGGFATEAQLRSLPRATGHAVGSLLRNTRVGREGKIGVRKGAGACSPRFFVDGQDIGVVDLPEQQFWLDRAKSVESYTAALAPARFTDFDGCGAIVVWTR